MRTAFTENNFELYNRDLNMMKHWIESSAMYDSIVMGTNYDDNVKLIVKGLKNKNIPYIDPKVMYLARDDGDREIRYSTMSRFMAEIEENDFILSPTMTAYTHPKDKVSVSSHYIESQLALRSKNKKLKAFYDNKGQNTLANIYDNRQQRNKIKCNSLSGAQGTTSSVLFLKTAHSSLTSTCRSATSNTNANTERLLSGNRHYWSVNTAIENIVSIVINSDKNLVEQAIEKYNLVIPTPEYMIKAIKRCTDLYFDDVVQFKFIEELVNKLEDWQRVAWTYTGDLYNAANLNDGVIRNLVAGLCEFRLDETELLNKEEAKEYLSIMGDDEYGLIGIVANPLLLGGKIWDVDKESVDYLRLGTLAKRIANVMTDYDLYFRTFMVNRNICPSMALFPESVRSIIVGSDTDSCIFTNQAWVEWYNEIVDDSPRAFSCSAALTYLASQNTVHVLAVMSANIGVPKEKLRHLQMKNEYAFNFFALTTMAKHYFASKNSCEGNVYTKAKWEQKGVTLKNTNAPKEIQEKSDALIRYLGTELNKKQQISLLDVIKEVANIEHSVIKEIRKGNPDYYGRTKIHDQNTYTKPAGWNKPNWGNHRHHVLWEQTFAKSYGHAPTPSYPAIKINATINSPTDWNNFMETITDEHIYKSLDNIYKIYKTPIKTFYLPRDTVNQSGVPKELYPIMDIRSMIAKIMKSFYLILESLGFFMLNGSISRLLSDEINYTPESKSILENYL